MMPKWEYKFVDLPERLGYGMLPEAERQAGVIEFLNELGEEGWELCVASQDGPGCILKRPLVSVDVVPWP